MHKSLFLRRLPSPNVQERGEWPKHYAHRQRAVVGMPGPIRDKIDSAYRVGAGAGTTPVPTLVVQKVADRKIPTS